MDVSTGPRKRRKLSASDAAPYVLWELLDDVPVQSESGEPDVHITCVEFWNDNLYIGTSAAEILHFVSLPPEPSDEASEPTLILASRLQINGNPNKKYGIQQIVLLPTAGKACVLCNGVVTFYTLPELSPAFENTRVSCQWIGGLDLDHNATDSPVLMIAVSNRINLVKIGDIAQGFRRIEFPGCLIGARRDTIACVADENAYFLLEVEHQQKIPLFPISSVNEVFESGHVEDIPQSTSTLKRSSSATYTDPTAARKNAHTRSTSLNVFADHLSGGKESPRSSQDLSSSSPPGLGGIDSPRRSVSRDRGNVDTSKDLPTLPPSESTEEEQKPLPPAPKVEIARLKPHIVSPTPSEFLLVTGTQETEPGVGIFVNTEGDVVRGTIEFQQYPESVVLDTSSNTDPTAGGTGSSEGFVLAVLEMKENETACKYLEIQRWDVDPGEGGRKKALLEIPTTEGSKTSRHVGIRNTFTSSKLHFFELGETLRKVKLKTPSTGGTYTPAEETDPRTNATIEQLRKEKELFESQELTDSESGKKPGSRSWEKERTKEEFVFAHGLGNIQSNLLLWSGRRIWRVSKNPLPLQLDGLLEDTQAWEDGQCKSVDREAVIDLLDSIKSIEPTTEAEFLGLGYIKQKAGLILFADLLSMDISKRNEATMKATEEVLVDSDLDPRLILFLVPFLADEVLQARQGIWVHRGLAQVAEFYLNHFSQSKGVLSVVPDNALLNMIKRYLTAWQRKRGYGSVTDETNVFDSVDAALLHLILEQESQSMKTIPSVTTATRSELNALVDHWKGNFDRAVSLLERYRRLFILSRLYQSRKMSGNVLRTWQRIVDGAKDDDPEVSIPGVEVHARKYLCKMRDVQLLEHYGSWLASRNPSLGIQVFSDDTARVKLKPDQVVTLLKERAPNAVQNYLEHLVFSKNNTQYADDLIAYYLDTVINVLQSSPEARASLRESYSTYRALRPPKPTYLSFINENTPQESWWQSRLRLLQLLGGPSTVFTSTAGTGSLSYSVPAVLARIEPFQDELVSESIILDGRQGRHKEALRLLTHGLGDYDSAIRYCIFGGISSSQPATTITLPPPSEDITYTEPAELFRYLLLEFLQIDDVPNRIERTSDLLARFSRWFDVNEVLATIPDDWSLDILSDFFVYVFRDLVSQGREAQLEKALSASLNLRVSVEYAEDIEKRGGWIEDKQGLRRMKSSGTGHATTVGAADDHGVDVGNEEDEFGDMIEAAK